MNKAFQWLADMAFPVRCIICRTLASPKDLEYICRGCLGDIRTTRPLECIGCKSPSRDGSTCPWCRKNGWHVDQLLIAADYEQKPLQTLLHAYKYQFVRDLHRPLVHLLLKSIAHREKTKSLAINQDNPIVTSVPLSPYRLRWRGFDHTALLARGIADAHLLSYVPNILTRPPWQRPQTDMTERDERLNNVLNSFSCASSEPMTNKSIVIIDDVCTTGATLNECARTLKQSGVARVQALVIARGYPKRPHQVGEAF